MPIEPAATPTATTPASSPANTATIQAYTTGRWHRTPAAFAWFAALIGWTLLISFYDLDGGAEFEPIDCWVAQTAREMYETHDLRGLVIPTFSGEVRLQKSPGPYWAVMLTAWLRGTEVNEVAVRIPNAVFAVILVVTIFWLTRRIAGDRAAVFAGFAAASSALVLYWSHRGASDLGVTTLMTVSLAALWIGSEHEFSRGRRAACWMLGYFAAGLAMLYKMPMPLVCIGLPAFLYVLLFNRWRIFKSWWHLLGILLFLLPWVPWIAAVLAVEPIAWHKWQVEFFDRFTGELPNVQDQKADWRLYFLYVGVAFVYTAPYCLSIPGAIARAFRRHEGVDRRGSYFLLLWFWGLFVFFTAAAGKETRYLLPAIPPLLVMLGIELAAFFHPQRPVRPTAERIGMWAIWVAFPAGIVLGGYFLRRFFLKRADLGFIPWEQLWPPLLLTAVLFALSCMLAAWLYVRRHEHGAFAALVAGMWITWMWAWPQLMPVLMSQAPFRDFAQQLKLLDADQRAHLQQIAQQDPRIIWYSDVRFPRIIDQLELLEMQGGQRDSEREIRIVGEEMIRELREDDLALLVCGPVDYITFEAKAPIMLEAQGEAMPQTHVWFTARSGRYDRRYVLFSNRPRPAGFPQPDTAWFDAKIDAWQAKLRAAPQSVLEESLPGPMPAPAPASAPG